MKDKLDKAIAELTNVLYNLAEDAASRNDVYAVHQIITDLRKVNSLGRRYVSNGFVRTTE